MHGSQTSLPATIVRRLLERSGEVAARSGAMAADFVRGRESLRESMLSAGLIVDIGDLNSYAPLDAVAVDGAVVVDNKRFGDVCATVAVAASFPVVSDVEVDDDHDCDVWMDVARRHAKNSDAAKGLMSSQEMGLAVDARSDMVMLDGSFISTLINMSTGIAAAKSLARAAPGPLAERMGALRSEETRSAVMTLITEKRFVAFPKYTTTNEFEDHIPSLFRGFDAKTVSTIALEPGEMTVYVEPERSPSSEARRDLLSPAFGFEGARRKEFLDALESIRSFYYRPHPWSPALRIDVPADGDDPDDMPRMLRTVRDSMRIAGMSEPLPLYLADRWAKQVSAGAAPAVDMAAMAHVDDPAMKMLFAFDYRT